MYSERIKKYGAKNQVDKTVEELDEIIEVLDKIKKMLEQADVGEPLNTELGKNYVACLASEIADGEIMFTQLKIMFKMFEMVANEKAYKDARQHVRDGGSWDE